MTGYQVRVEAEQVDEPPQVFNRVRIRHLIRGYDVDPGAVEAAIRLSEEKYCSVGAMVCKTAEFETTYEIARENAAETDRAEVLVGAHS